MESKEQFYHKLDSVVGRCPAGDDLVVQGDFNAETGSDRAGYELCLGPHGPALEPRMVTASFSLSLRSEGDSGLGVPGSRDRFRAGWLGIPMQAV